MLRWLASLICSSFTFALADVLCDICIAENHEGAVRKVESAADDEESDSGVELSDCATPVGKGKAGREDGADSSKVALLAANSSYALGTQRSYDSVGGSSSSADDDEVGLTGAQDAAIAGAPSAVSLGPVLSGCARPSGEPVWRAPVSGCSTSRHHLRARLSPVRRVGLRCRDRHDRHAMHSRRLLALPEPAGHRRVRDCAQQGHRPQVEADHPPAVLVRHDRRSGAVPTLLLPPEGVRGRAVDGAPPARAGRLRFGAARLLGRRPLPQRALDHAHARARVSRQAKPPPRALSECEEG